MSVIDVIGTPVAQVLKGIHTGLSTVLDPASGWAWGLSIVLLTVFVRLLLFPLFVKQIKSQRRMQELAPKIKELQKVHKGDRETLNTEMMKLYKDNNANPISGCLPLLLQLPVFFALFSVIREFKPQSNGQPALPRFGLSAEDLAEGGRASIFGAPVSAALNSTRGVHRPAGRRARDRARRRRDDARADGRDDVLDAAPDDGPRHDDRPDAAERPEGAAVRPAAVVRGLRLQLPDRRAPLLAHDQHLVDGAAGVRHQADAPAGPGRCPLPSGKGGSGRDKVDLAKRGASAGDGGRGGVAVAESASAGTGTPGSGSKGPGSTGPAGTPTSSGSRPVAGPGAARRAAGSRKNKTRRGGRR